MNVSGQLKESLQALVRRRNLVIFFAMAQVVFFVFGQWTVQKQIPMVMELRQQTLAEVKNLVYLKPLVGAFAGNVILQIVYTFGFNLIFGAFLSTTATGVVFFAPYMIAVWRSFLVGILTYGFIDTPSAAVAFYGTFALEFAAYCLSSAIGTDIGLTLIWPARKGRTSRKEALREATRDGANMYVLVAVCLFIAAIWEITALHLSGPLF